MQEASPSKKVFARTLFLFRRDLRLEDNTGLSAAIEQSHEVIPCFIFDPRQVGPENEYRSGAAIRYMLDALIDLNEQLKARDGKLFLFEGKADSVVAHLVATAAIEAVMCNRDYTPFSRARDKAIASVCETAGVSFVSFADALLHEPEAIVTTTGTPYAVFTPFFKKAVTQGAPRVPVSLAKASFYGGELDGVLGDLEQGTLRDQLFARYLGSEPHREPYGGRTLALKQLERLAEQASYGQRHDYPAYTTSRLSAHLKFGTLSVREAYAAIERKLGASSPLVRQLYWRDFFTHVAYHTPKVLQGEPYHEEYQKLIWDNDSTKFAAWCTGMTGFPIVDAGMRELKATGFMHNRVRMITASFLVKDLHIDWRWGEKYFATQLVDYDPAVNNGNWQWVASTGCDAQPYFRIFNPWLQQKRFDSEGAYIKRWVPELMKVPAPMLHTLYRKPVAGYPSPIVDHATEAREARARYQTARRG